ncbi:MAG TPA: hypothetical protein VM580_29485, partial [Labilithrix sp.]|nr:hypothetical protein [Labilithrix sp.]
SLALPYLRRAMKPSCTKRHSRTHTPILAALIAFAIPLAACTASTEQDPVEVQASVDSALGHGRPPVIPAMKWLARLPAQVHGERAMGRLFANGTATYVPVGTGTGYAALFQRAPQLNWLPSQLWGGKTFGIVSTAGVATWHLFAAERGDFFRTSQKVTWNGTNMLRVVDSRGRDDRFERMGVLNDPDCTKQTEPDEFGLYIDNCLRDPYSTGVVGLRLRPNPDFDMDAWKALGDGDVNKAAERWLRAPRNRFEWKGNEMARVAEVEPPYEVSMTCTVCDAAPNPLNPPANPNEASWKNIVFALGNQFFNEGAVFADSIPKDDFLSEVVNAQHPGTSDTSRMATDHIHNPNTINAIFNLAYRPLHHDPGLGEGTITRGDVEARHSEPLLDGREASSDRRPRQSASFRC